MSSPIKNCLDTSIGIGELKVLQQQSSSLAKKNFEKISSNNAELVGFFTMDLALSEAKNRVMMLIGHSLFQPCNRASRFLHLPKIRLSSSWFVECARFIREDELLREQPPQLTFFTPFNLPCSCKND